MVKLFIAFEFGKIVKYFKSKTLAKSITSLLFVAVFLFVGFGIYHFFVSGFRFINAEALPDIRAALTLFLYEVFTVVLAGIIIFSSFLSSLFSLFKGDRNTWIISSPSYTMFPKMIFMRSLLSSSVPLLILFIPAILAMCKVYHLTFLAIFFIVLSVILFLAFLNALTMLALVLVGYIYYKISLGIRFITFGFKGLITLLLTAASLLLFVVWKIVTKVDLVVLFKAEDASDTLSITNISNIFHFLPTHPFAVEIISWQNGLHGVAFVNFLLLTILTSISIFVWFKSSHLFYPLWQKFQEGTPSNTSKRSFLGKEKAYHFNGSKTMALFKKEALVSSRNWKGVLWFFFFFSIWLLQIAANVVLNHNIQRYVTDLGQKIITLQILQFIIAIYFISSFTLRFVFPSFSVEKKTAWILGSAPLSFTRIFFGKYFFYTSFFVTLGIIMNYVSSLVLKVPFTNALYSMILFVSVIVFIVTLGLSLGALFPNTETDDPEIITTSMSGLFFTAIALLYGALSDWILYRALTLGNNTELLMFVLFTCMLVGIFLVKVPKQVASRML